MQYRIDVLLDEFTEANGKWWHEFVIHPADVRHEFATSVVKNTEKQAGSFHEEVREMMGSLNYEAYMWRGRGVRK